MAISTPPGRSIHLGGHGLRPDAGFGTPILDCLGRAKPWLKPHRFVFELEIERTSCTSFEANQFRLLLTSAAYFREIQRLGAEVKRSFPLSFLCG